MGRRGGIWSTLARLTGGISSPSLSESEGFTIWRLLPELLELEDPFLSMLESVGGNGRGSGTGVSRAGIVGRNFNGGFAADGTGTVGFWVGPRSPAGPPRRTLVA